MVDKFERKCVELFGECHLDIHDIVAANSIRYKELILEAAVFDKLKVDQKITIL